MPSDPLFDSQESLVDRKKILSYTRILNHLFEHGSNSIAKLAKEIHTSVPSVTAMLDELKQHEWVREKGASKTKSGRRPVNYGINGSKKVALVLDINLYETNFIFINLNNEIITKTSFEIDLEKETYLKEIIREVDQLLKINDQPWAIGISAPGLIETESGLNYTHQNLNKESKSLALVLEEKYKLHVFNINDTRASLLGEHHYGLARNKKNVLLVNLDWGVGLGILHNGQIVEGAAGFAGELGHVQVYPDGELCACGKIGCLETVASASTIVRKAKAGLKEGKATSLNQENKDLFLSDVIAAAINGDEFSIDIIYEVGRELGKGLAMAVHLFNPETIIIDGILKNAGDLIVSTVKQSINKYCLVPFKQNLDVIISPLGDDAKVYGTKSFVFKKMMEYYAN
ncbi:ROK family transcriptional regulator [Jiulongibacter sediminis]|uniref:ROK family transcriptional regulator n=1 Tax=Jiulongibacter sediminis TaxID=1605367 RepID=UPI0026F2E079|nr:ROK family transcriptional regulator [Jiulongibacter sediminis]